MESELQSIKKYESELLKIRLAITEKEQEREKIQKTNDGLAYGGGLFFFFTICAFFAENKLLAIIPGIITGIFMFFGMKNGSKISKLIQDIKVAKKRKKQLENEINGLEYLAKVKAEKKVS